MNSPKYMAIPNSSCFRLFLHEVCFAFSLARAKAGRRRAARIAIIAMTTSSSMSVKADVRDPFDLVAEMCDRILCRALDIRSVQPNNHSTNPSATAANRAMAQGANCGLHAVGQITLYGLLA